MKPTFTPSCPPAFKIGDGSNDQPVTAQPKKEQQSAPDPVRRVIEALCEGLNLANNVGDANKAELFNEALVAFTDLSYERGRFTRENELLRTDVEGLVNEVNRLMKERK